MKRLMIFLSLLIVAAIPSLPANAAGALPRVTVVGANMMAGGKVFIPRGDNYLRMAGDRLTTFEEGEYDPVQAESFFIRMKAFGKNADRAFVPQGDWQGKGVGGPLVRKSTHKTLETSDYFNPAVIANIVDYVKRGAKYGVYTSLVLQDIPTNCYFYGIVGNGKCSTDYSISNVYGVNAMFMDPQYIKAKAEYMRLFAAEMKTRLGTDINAIMSYSSDNEATFQTDQAPFTNWDASTVTLVGKTYQMNVAAERQEAADASLVNYTILVRDGLKRGDPNANFTLGVYTNYAVNKTGFDGLTYCSGPAPCKVTVNYPDFRYPARISKILTLIDIAEVHFYPRPLTWDMVPGVGKYTVAKDLATVELSGANLKVKPLVIGEFGAFKNFYATVDQAAVALKVAQQAACQLGADGYLLWSHNSGQVDLYDGLQDNMRVGRELAPSVYPDPCSVNVSARR